MVCKNKHQDPRNVKGWFFALNKQSKLYYYLADFTNRKFYIVVAKTNKINFMHPLYYKKVSWTLLLLNFKICYCF